MNKLILGDNLEVLRALPSESVDLIYLDPPFFSNRHYECIWGDKGEVRSFEDRWSGGIEHYIAWLRERVQEMHRVLKSTGSIYLHCDHHADAYIRVYILDPIFGSGNFRNEIVWKRTNKVKGTAGDYGSITDTIWFYTKTCDFLFNNDRIPLSADQLERYYHNVEPDTNRRFNHGGMWLPGDSPKTLYFRDRQTEIEAPAGKRYRWSQDTYDAKYEANPLCIFWNGKDNPRYKIYADEHEGIPVGNIWGDITDIQSSNALYPTQKPEALLERIIKASSNEGDIVLDPFVGGGTTVAVANRLGRQWIGIDQSAQAVRVSENRINNQGLTSEFVVVLHKYDYDDLFTMDPFKFESWIVQQFGGVSNMKQHGDAGIDGHMLDGTPVQVKQSEGIGRNVIDNLRAASERYDKTRFQTAITTQKPVACLIAFSFGKGAIAEVARLKLEQGIEIRLVRVDQIVQIAKKPKIILHLIQTPLKDGKTSVEFEVHTESETGISFYSWDWDYEQDTKVFKPEVQIDLYGKQTHVFNPGTYTIAVKAVDENGLETVAVQTFDTSLQA